VSQHFKWRTSPGRGQNSKAIWGGGAGGKEHLLLPGWCGRASFDVSSWSGSGYSAGSLTIIPVILMPTAKMCVQNHSILQFTKMFMVLHTWTTMELENPLVPSTLTSSTVELIYGYYFLGRRSSDLRTDASSTTWVELLSTRFTGTSQWQLSATSLLPTHCSKGWTKLPAQWASTHGNRAKWVTIVRPFQTTFVTMITHVSSAAIVFNLLSSSFNSLRSGNMCRMVQQWNSIILRNVSTQGWNRVTAGGMNMYVIWISS